MSSPSKAPRPNLRNLMHTAVKAREDDLRLREVPVGMGNPALQDRAQVKMACKESLPANEVVLANEGSSCSTDTAVRRIEQEKRTVHSGPPKKAGEATSSDKTANEPKQALACHRGFVASPKARTVPLQAQAPPALASEALAGNRAFIASPRAGAVPPQAQAPPAIVPEGSPDYLAADDSNVWSQSPDVGGTGSVRKWISFTPPQPTRVGEPQFNALPFVETPASNAASTEDSPDGLRFAGLSIADTTPERTPQGAPQHLWLGAGVPDSTDSTPVRWVPPQPPSALPTPEWLR